MLTDILSDYSSIYTFRRWKSFATQANPCSAHCDFLLYAAVFLLYICGCQPSDKTIQCSLKRLVLINPLSPPAAVDGAILLSACPFIPFFSGPPIAWLFSTAFFFPLQHATPQQVPNCTRNPIKLKPTAIHINASMGFPKLAWILSWGADSKVLRKMTNMTVATTLAPAVKRRARNVQTMSGISRQRIRRPRWCQPGLEEKPIGARKMQVKVMQVPTRKDANIQCDAMRASLRAELI